MVVSILGGGEASRRQSHRPWRGLMDIMWLLIFSRGMRYYAQLNMKKYAMRYIQTTFSSSDAERSALYRRMAGVQRSEHLRRLSMSQ